MRLGKWFIITGIFTVIATYIMNNQTLAAPNQSDLDVRISKITENIEEHPGTARMVLIDAEDNLVHEFDVEANVGYTKLENIAPGNYTLKEIKTLDGYSFGADVRVEVLDTTEVQTFEFLNVKSNSINVSLSMRDIGLNTLVKNSRIQLLDVNDNVIDICDSTYYSPCIFQNLEVGAYTIKELSTPPGYISMVDRTFEITESDAGKTIEIVEPRDFTKLEICKIDTSSGEQLPNAVFELYNEQNELYDRFTTDKYVRYIERIPVGTYTLKEVTAPPGYEPRNEEHTIIITETPEIVYINAYNSPTIDVPNTSINESMIFYIIGGFLLLLGIIVVSVSYKKNYK